MHGRCLVISPFNALGSLKKNGVGMAVNVATLDPLDIVS